MKKYLCFLIFLIIIISTTASCSQEPEQQVPEVIEILEEENGQDKETIKNKDLKELNFTLWSWQLPSPEIAESYVEKIKKAGFTGIDFCVTWNKIEQEQNHFNWAYLDSIMDVFVKYDMNINVSLLLWTTDLLWSDSFIYQKTSNDIIYVNNGNLCLNSIENLKIIKNTVQAFAYHINKKYSSYITRWNIRTSEFGTVEYSTQTDLDYSDSAISAFYDYLILKYNNIENLIEKYELKFEIAEDLTNNGIKELPRICSYDWKLFKQQTLIDFINFTTGIFKTANKEIPVAFQIGDFTDALAGFSRGTFDIYKIAHESEADIIHLNSIDEEHLFTIDIISSISDKDIGLQIDGAWQGEDIFNDYLAQTMAAGESDIKYLNTANWELDDIEKYSDSYLSKFAPLFFETVKRVEPDNETAILVNTVDFILKNPPLGLYSRLGKSYLSLSGLNNKKVKFVSDTMLLKNPNLLTTIKKLYLGTADSIVYIDEAFAKLLLDSGCLIIYEEVNEINFLNQYKQPLAENIQDALRNRILD